MNRGKNKNEGELEVTWTNIASIFLMLLAKTNEADVSITTSKSFLSTSVQLILLSIAGLIVYKTVSDVGIILYTFHPTLMAVGVSFRFSLLIN